MGILNKEKKMAKGKNKDIDEPVLKVKAIADSIPYFLMKWGITNEKPKNVAITLLLVRPEQAEEALKEMNPEYAEKIKRELLFIQVQTRALL